MTDHRSTLHNSSGYADLGYMQMPSDFKYKDVLIQGYPQHEKWDDFSLKHPPMPVSKWAKIFCPFDALKGFRELIERS